jgi:hypothetical protein
MDTPARFNRLTLDLGYAKGGAIVLYMSVDGRPWAGPGDTVACILPLRKSLDQPGDYFFVTCTCGDAGCAGIFSPTQVRHEDGAIRWLVPSRRKRTPIEQYVFAKAHYQFEIERAVRHIRGTAHSLAAHPANLHDILNDVRAIAEYEQARSQRL